MPPMDDIGDMGEPPMDDTSMPPADDMGGPMPEMTEDYDNEGYQYGGRFNESKIDRIISNYFEKSPNEPKTDKRLIENFKKVRNLSKSMLQLETSKSFLKNNKNYNVIGITNLDNIILESKNNKVKIDKRGNII
jgi:hypothetical protein